MKKEFNSALVKEKINKKTKRKEENGKFFPLVNLLGLKLWRMENVRIRGEDNGSVHVADNSTITLLTLSLADNIYQIHPKFVQNNFFKFSHYKNTKNSFTVSFSTNYIDQR